MPWSTWRLGWTCFAGHRDLAKLELSLAGERHREEFVNDLLRTEASGYDIVIIDCPPNLGLLTVNALVAASEVLVPVNMTDEGALQASPRSALSSLSSRDGPTYASARSSGRWSTADDRLPADERRSP